MGPPGMRQPVRAPIAKGDAEEAHPDRSLLPASEPGPPPAAPVASCGREPAAAELRRRIEPRPQGVRLDLSSRPTPASSILAWRTAARSGLAHRRASRGLSRRVLGFAG